MRIGFVIIAAVLTAAAPAPTAVKLETGLAGQWAGTLGYRDYQSNTLFKLKVKTQIRVAGDGVSAVRVSEFDEGPGRTPAYITSASLYDPAAGTVSIATLRKGRVAELVTDRLRVNAYADAAHWTVVDEVDSVDDGKPAKLRVTQVRDGDRLTATKEVMPAGTSAWAFRNVTELVRVGD